MSTDKTVTEKPKTTKMMTRGKMMTITVIAAVIVYFLWNVDALSPVVYPFRLFVTYVHEAGHSLAALASGGKVIGFRVFSNGAGLATTQGGSRALILPAGYLGAALFGAALFFILNTRPYARTIAILLGIALFIFSILYARPDQEGVPVALLVGVLGGLGLIGLGWKARREINLLVLNVLAIMTALNAVLDVYTLVRYADITMHTRHGEIRNDAAAFAEEVTSFLPASVWAFLWALIAIAMLSAAVYYSLLRPMLREADRLLAKNEQDTKPPKTP